MASPTQAAVSAEYVWRVDDDRDVLRERRVLEFAVELDGLQVNGVDMLHWNDDGRIVDFKVMVRPLKAINLVHQKMAAMLAAATSG